MSTTTFSRLARRALPSGTRLISQASPRTLTTSARLSANTPSAGQHISQVAQSEGGTSQGSQSAQMQSELTRQRNYEQAAQQVGQKLQNDPSSVTSQEANRLESKEHKLTGVRPGSDSMAAEAKRVASANEPGRTPNTSTSNINTNAGTTNAANPTAQSAAHKEQNFQDAVSQVQPKLEQDPASITEEDAALLRSREVRAHGGSEKGGVAAMAQKQVARNQGATKA